MECVEVLKIGFLNDVHKNDIEKYAQCFDFLIVNDGNMDIVEGILRIIGRMDLDLVHPDISLFLTEFYTTLIKI